MAEREYIIGTTDLNLDDLTDVVASPAEGEVLKFRDDVWVADEDENNGGSPPPTELNDLTDVDTESDEPQAEDVLAFDAGDSQWVPAVLETVTAEEILLDTSGFDGLLDSGVENLQLLADAVDELVLDTDIPLGVIILDAEEDVPDGTLDGTKILRRY